MNVREHAGTDDAGAPARRRLTVSRRAPTRRERSASNIHAAPQTNAGPVRGRLLAVCGLCGGAGASTLAYLVALAAARRHPGAVLVGDTGGPERRDLVLRRRRGAARRWQRWPSTWPPGCQPDS